MTLTLLTPPSASPKGTIRRTVGGRELRISRKIRRVPGTARADFKVVSDQLVTLDKAKAEEYLSLPEFDGERKPSEDWVQRLRDEMARGSFVPQSVLLASAWLDDTRYKINGQHTCWAIFLSTGDPSYQVREVVYRVDDLKQLKLLYSKFDVGRTRSVGHRLRVLLCDTPELADIPPELVEKIALAIRFWQIPGRDERDHYQPEQTAALALKHHLGTFKKVGDYLAELPREHRPRNQPLLAAMCATFDKAPVKAAEFWTPVLDGVGLPSRTDPRYVLRTLIQNSMLRDSRKHSDGSKESILAEDLYAACIHAWNKWRSGESIKQLRPRAIGKRPKLR